MATLVEESYLITLSVPGITDDQFRALCEQYENYRVEYSADEQLIVMPLADPETSSRNADITVALKLWARKDGRGVVTLRKKPTRPEFVIEILSPSDRPRRSTPRCSTGLQTAPAPV